MTDIIPTAAEARDLADDGCEALAELLSRPTTTARRPITQRILAEMQKTPQPEAIGSPIKTLKGASEIDLVRSGLDDIMRSAYGQISAIWNVKSEIPDLRTAAYSIAISRCADAYSAIGI